VATTAVHPAPAPAARPYWLLIAATCLVPAALGAFQTYVQARLGGQGPVPWDDVIFSGSDWLLLGAVTPIACLLARHFPLRRDAVARTAAAHMAGALALYVGWASSR
jgi:hypothetical protein